MIEANNVLLFPSRVAEAPSQQISPVVVGVFLGFMLGAAAVAQQAPAVLPDLPPRYEPQQENA